MRRYVWLAALAALAAGTMNPTQIAAQDSAAVAPATAGAVTGRAQATRAELEALLSGASDRELSEAERAEVRRRLEEGDFRPGDRIALTIFGGEQTISDTFVVRPARTILVPNLGELRVAGVLRSELDAHLRKELSRYLREPDIDATALIRVAVFGEVARPGYHSIPAEMLASDALMAGGPTPKSDVRRTIVRRNGVEIRSQEEVQAALDRGLSLDQMNVQSGDEFVVGTKGEGFMGVLRVAGILSGVALGIAALARVF